MNQPNNKKDMINPSHYGAGTGIECIDVMEQQFGREETQAFCKLNAFKYLFRLGKKDESLQEMKKVQWYVNKWIALEESKSKIDTKSTTLQLLQEAVYKIIGKESPYHNQSVMQSLREIQATHRVSIACCDCQYDKQECSRESCMLCGKVLELEDTKEKE